MKTTDNSQYFVIFFLHFNRIILKCVRVCVCVRARACVCVCVCAHVAITMHSPQIIFAMLVKTFPLSSEESFIVNIPCWSTCN